MYFDGFIYHFSLMALATAKTAQRGTINSASITDSVPNPTIKANASFNVSSPSAKCEGACDSTYKRAFTCGLGENVVFNMASNIAFDPQCLCNSGEFLQDAPGCIQCLFDNPDKDITSRSKILAMMGACVDGYNVIPCPKYCAPILPLITYCDGIDGAHRAGNPPPDPKYHPPPTGSTGTDSDVFPCICREGYKNMVDTCFNCVKKWDIYRALKWQGVTKQCIPPKSKKLSSSHQVIYSQRPRESKTHGASASSIAKGDNSGVLKGPPTPQSSSQLAIEASGGRYSSVVPHLMLFS